MSVNESVQSMVESLANFSGSSLSLLLCLTFVVGMVFRILIFYTVRRHEWFSKEFEKRVGRFIDNGPENNDGAVSFFMTTKRLLEKTYYEIFESREKLKRRKPDGMMTVSDRLFLIKLGSAWLIRDTLKQIRFLKHKDKQPNLMNITKNAFQSNPCFTRVFGIFPSSGINDVLNVLPGLFVIGGIFGTFLGIMKGLPELSGMNISNVEQTKLVMDRFLGNIAFSMHTSIIGIFFSVCMNITNTVFSPEKVFADMVDRFEHCLSVMWNMSDNNDVLKDTGQASADRDPLETLAEESLNRELGKKERIREMDKIRSKEKGKNAS